MNKIQLSNDDRKKIQSIETKILVEVDRICKKHNITYSVAYGSMIGAVRHHGSIPWDDDVDITMLRNDYIRFKEICKTELSSEFFYQSNDTDPNYYHLFDKIRMNNTIFKETFLSNYDIHHGVYIDIFPVDLVPQKKLQQVIQYYGFLFCRIALNSKYLNIEARSGKKKFFAQIVRFLTAFVSKDFLYKKAHDFISKYKDSNSSIAESFCCSGRKKTIYDINYYKETTSIEYDGYLVSIYSHYDEMLKDYYGNYMELPPIQKRNTKHDLVEVHLNEV